MSGAERRLMPMEAKSSAADPVNGHTERRALRSLARSISEMRVSSKRISLLSSA
jgi:hypothetical protein